MYEPSTINDLNDSEIMIVMMMIMVMAMMMGDGG